MKADAITFQVPGKPAPQGSKTKWGTESSPRLKPWRAAVAEAAYNAMEEVELLEGPLNLEAVFLFLRPKAHYRTGKHADELKPGVSGYKDTTPDLDKLTRAVCDAMQGIVYRNDSQVAAFDGTRKVYGPKEGLIVTVTRIGA